MYKSVYIYDIYIYHIIVYRVILYMEGQGGLRGDVQQLEAEGVLTHIYIYIHTIIYYAMLCDAMQCYTILY